MAMTEVPSLVDEHRKGSPCYPGLDELFDAYYVLGHALHAPEHHWQLAGHSTEFDTSVRGLVLELGGDQYFTVNVAGD